MVAVLALASRIFFVHGSVNWFDSQQYLWRSQDPLFLHALSTGHGPFHPGYVGWTWLAVHLFGWTNLGAPYLMGLTTAVFGSLALVVFFRLAERWTNTASAVIATFVAAMTPFLWVGSLGILIDPVMIFWYLLSLLLFDLALTKLPERSGAWLVLASGFALGLSFFAHTQIAFWAVAYVSIAIIRWHDVKRASKRDLAKLLLFLIGPIFFIWAYLYLLVYAGHDATYLHALKYLLGGNAGDHAPFSLDFSWRNWRAVAGTTFALVSVTVLAVVSVRKWKLGLPLLVWFIPGVIISAPYLYTNLFGRSTINAVWPAAIAFGWVATQLWHWRKWAGMSLVALVVVSLYVQSVPLVWGYATGSSTVEEQGLAQRSLGNKVYAIQDPENVTLRGTDVYDTISVQSQNDIQDHVRAQLVAGNSVVIPSDSLRFPFANLDGRNYRIDSLAFKGAGQHGGEASYLYDMGALQLRTLPTSNLNWALYQLVITSPSFMERVDHAVEVMRASDGTHGVVVGRFVSNGTPVNHLAIDLYGSERLMTDRFDHNDWLAQAWAAMTNQRDPVAWSYTDRDGVVEIPLRTSEMLSMNQAVVTTDRLSSGTAIQAATGKSVASDTKNIDLTSFDGGQREVQHVTSLSALRAMLSTQYANSSVIVTVRSVQGDVIDADVVNVDYALPLTDVTEAEDLAHGPIATVVADTNGSGGAVVRVAASSEGTAMFGPYRTLPAGSYTASFKLAVPSDAHDDWDLGRIEIAGNADGSLIASHAPLLVSDVRAGTITVPFTLKQPTSFVEYRVWSRGAPTTFTIDSVTVTKQ